MSYSEDEGVDSAGSHCDSPGPCSDHDAKRLEYLLDNAFHWNDEDASLLRNPVCSYLVEIYISFSSLC